MTEPARSLGFFERGDQIGQGAVLDPSSVLGGGDGERDGQVRLPDPRRAEEDDVFLTRQEAELVEAIDLLAGASVNNLLSFHT